MQTVTSPVVANRVNSQTGAVTNILNTNATSTKVINGINGLQTSGIGAGSGPGSQLGYSFQGNYYDSPMIYSAVLTGLTGGVTYFYKPSDNCNTFSFVMPMAPGTSAQPLHHSYTLLCTPALSLYHSYTLLCTPALPLYHLYTLLHPFLTLH